jgi:NRAMP (natural resistance-associated macrophage protein)-like metal ion transporter
MKKALEITLGVVTSIGGFIDAGSFATALQAGARFGYRLIWATLLGTICAIFLTKMSGRLAAVSSHPLRELIHKRFGFNYSALLLLGGFALNLLVIASEIGGVSIALELATGIPFRWWALPVAAFVWALLWFLTFGVIEKAISFAGLVTLAFVIGAFKLHHSVRELVAGAVPPLPSHDPANYWYIAVSIIGSIITPFMFFFLFFRRHRGEMGQELSGSESRSRDPRDEFRLADRVRHHGGFRGRAWSPGCSRR